MRSQKELLRNYFASHPELQECGMEVDDGYSGSNFVRPGFEKLMEAVKAGLVDCIVVKDLSRFGRNYLETGEYLEKIFPRLNVRFISIGDHYDSADWNIQSCDFIIPFINLVNEAYCGDISRKIRSQLEIKRIYIGVLEQGKVTTPSYKVKKLVHKPKSEWIVIEDNHTDVSYFRNQESLSYEMIHELIERIEVSDKGEIKVKFRCCNDIRCLEDFTSCMNGVGNI